MAGCVKCGRWFWNRSGNLPPICPRCAGRQPAAVDAATAGAVQRPIITWALASACVIVFLLMIADGASVFEPSADQVLAWGGDFGPATLGNDWWRLVTATFVHFGLLHLALNMWCLVTLGPIAERVFGRGSFLLLYLLSGIAGSTTSLLVHPLIVGAGASGAIFGVAGAVVAERPDFAPAQYALGSAYLQHENPAEAIPPLRAAARLVPNDLEYQNDLGVALLRHHQADSAIAVFERAVALAPENARSYSNLGLAYQSGERPADAVGAFQKAVKFEPTTRKYRFFLGRAYLANQEFDKAVATFNLLLANDPRNSGALLA